MKVYSVERTFAMTLLSAATCATSFCCDPVTVNFGELEPTALANIYFEKSGTATFELGAYCAEPQSLTQNQHLLMDEDGYEAVWVSYQDSVTLRILHVGQVVHERAFSQSFLDSGQFERIEIALRK